MTREPKDVQNRKTLLVLVNQYYLIPRFTVFEDICSFLKEKFSFLNVFSGLPSYLLNVIFNHQLRSISLCLKILRLFLFEMCIYSGHSFIE